MPPKALLSGAENAALRRRLARDVRAVQGALGVAPPLDAAFHAAQSASWTQQVMNAVTVAPREGSSGVRAPADPPPAHAAFHGVHAAGSLFFSSLGTIRVGGEAATGYVSSAPSRRAGDTGLAAYAGSAQATASPMPQAGSMRSVAGVDDARQPRVRALAPGASAYSGQPDADLAGGGHNGAELVPLDGTAPGVPSLRGGGEDSDAARQRMALRTHERVATLDDLTAIHAAEPAAKKRKLLPGGPPGRYPPNTLCRTVWERVNMNTCGLLDEALDLFTS